MEKNTSRLRMFGATLGMAALLVGLQAPAASSDDGYHLENVNSFKQLEIGGWATNDGATANQWALNNGANQRWSVYTYDLDWRYIENAYTGKCLEIADWRKDNGAPARQWDCHGDMNQQWVMK